MRVPAGIFSFRERSLSWSAEDREERYVVEQGL